MVDPIARPEMRPASVLLFSLARFVCDGSTFSPMTPSVPVAATAFEATSSDGNFATAADSSALNACVYRSIVKVIVE